MKFNYFVKIWLLLLPLTAMATESKGTITDSGSEVVEHQDLKDQLNQVIARRKSLTLDDLKQDTLPINSEERDRLLLSFYNETIPIFLSWGIARLKTFPFLMSQNDYWIPERFFTPFPYNPFREPGMDKLFLFPGNMEQWNNIIEEYKIRRKTHEDLVKDCEELLKEFQENHKIQVIDEQYYFNQEIKPLIIAQNISELEIPDHFLLKSLLTRPSIYAESNFKIHKIYQDELLQLLYENWDVDLEYDNALLSEKNINNIRKFMEYHKNQLNKINDYLMMVEPIFDGEKNNYPILDPKEFLKELPGVIDRLRKNQTLTEEQIKVKDFLDLLKPFFLGSQKPISDLIKIKPLQAKGYHDIEVIVYDTEHAYSKYLNYSPLSSQSHYSEIKQNEASSQSALETPSHSTAVSGIIGANQNLEQLQGVISGATILPIKEITPGTLDLIRKSKARVINISMGNAFPKSCQKYFEEKNSYIPLGSDELKKPPHIQHYSEVNSPSEQEKCGLFWEFVQLVHEKDLVLVQSAGNEGIQLEEIDWKTGQPVEDLTNSARGHQDERDIGGEYNGLNIDGSYIYRQIPQLKGRLILVGSILSDGKTIASYSSLPGAFPDIFIYAPGDVTTLYSSSLLGTKPTIYGPVGFFSGTSAAAPYVSGVLAYLGKLFPDLSMTKISQIVLETADPFWKESSLTDYERRIYGRGKLNAETAYARCLEENEKRRETKNVSLGRSEDYSHPVRQEEDNPLYKIMQNSGKLDNNLITEVEVYYSKNQQLPVNDEKLGMVAPLRIAIDLEGVNPGLIDALLKTKNKPRLTQVEALDILQKLIAFGYQVQNNIPLSLFKYLMLDKKIESEKYDSEGMKNLFNRVVKEKEYELAKHLVTKGIDPNIIFAGNRIINGLILSVSDSSDYDFVAFLLEKGAKPFVGNESPHSTNPFCEAIRKKDPILLEFLIKHLGKPSEQLKCMKKIMNPYGGRNDYRYFLWDEYLKLYPDERIQSILSSEGDNLK